MRTFAPGVEQHVNVIFRHVWQAESSCWTVRHNAELVTSNTRGWERVHTQFESVLAPFDNPCTPAVFLEFIHNRDDHVCAVTDWWDVACKTHKDKTIPVRIHKYCCRSSAFTLLVITNQVWAQGEVCHRWDWKDGTDQPTYWNTVLYGRWVSPRGRSACGAPYD